MSLLLDLFGYLTVLLKGLSLAFQGFAVGGVAFLLLLARPFAPALGETGTVILHKSEHGIVLSSLLLALVKAVTGIVAILVLVQTADLSLAKAAGADFAIADAVGMVSALVLCCAVRRPAPALIVPALGILWSALAVSHAESRLENVWLALGATSLHELGAAVWIGGLPYFLYALNRCNDGRAWRMVGRRYSLLSMAGVAMILAGGIVMAVQYVGQVSAIWGTAYGIMLTTKTCLFLGLLFLGFKNNQTVEALRRDPSTPILRLRRFVEVEIGVGITVLLTAASLTSLPPAIDLTTDRVTLAQIVERAQPRWPPTLESPSQADLALPRLQAEVDARAKAAHADSAQIYVPGAGFSPPTSTADLLWSEYNHNWAGVFVLILGMLAVAEKIAPSARMRRVARNWPLVFLGLAVFLFLRSDPESWPTGPVGFWASMRDPAIMQHRLFTLAIAVFGIFEWSVRTGRNQSKKAALVFPGITAFAGAMLLTHSHSLGNIREELLAEISHMPIAVLGITAAWTRWLELRLDPPGNKIAGRIWPWCFVGVGLILLFYRET